MAHNVKWGILGAASIAQRRVIPAMRNCEHAEVAAIASRSLERARDFAGKFSIPKAYGSYEELLADPESEAIYNQPRQTRALREAAQPQRRRSPPFTGSA